MTGKVSGFRFLEDPAWSNALQKRESVPVTPQTLINAQRF